MSHGFDFQIRVNGAESEGAKATKPKADRYRVPSNRYYHPSNPVDLRGRPQCARCNEILGARITTLYTDGDNFRVEPSPVYRTPVKMGVFCAVTALENGETLLAKGEV